MNDIQFHMCFLKTGKPGERKVISMPLEDTGLTEEQAAEFCIRFLDDEDASFWITIGQ